jgi:Na+-transporting NADH:ubiquinone oxidoreductase subunit B
MSRLRRLLDRAQPLFSKGGPYERFNALFEVVDTFFYTPSDVTGTAPHVRDGINVKRVMACVVIAALPCVLMALWNTGYQANTTMARLGIESAPGWRGAIIDGLDVGYDPESLWASIWHGLLYFLPIYLITLLTGGLWEALFAAVRNHEINEDFLVTSLLFTLTLPPSIPLWQVAVGISFGVVIAKEVFGGTGKNFLNPALAGRAFIFFAFPAQMSGDGVWTVVDGYSGATPLALAAVGGLEAVTNAGITWSQSFFGQLQGSLGETSALACLLGAAFLLYTQVASWRIIAGVLAGMVITTLLFNLMGSETNPMFALPWHWHLVLGGFAFGMVFMATDPVTAAMTDVGRWIYGLLIGFLTIAIRVANPAYPEGIMLAILFANIFAPLIDYFVSRANIKRRTRRNA